MLIPPTTKHLERMYFELSRLGAGCIGSNKPWPYEGAKGRETVISLASDMSRFDPRLFDVLVEYFINHWRDINPTRLRNCYKDMRCPQTLLVIGEFLKEAVIDDAEVDCFVKYLSSGINPVDCQFYFYNLYSPGGRLAARAVEEGLYEFKKWGFLAAERPVVNLRTRDTAGSFDKSARRNVLRRLFEEQTEIGLRDYINALHNAISRQQALLDIKSSGLKLIPIGKGRLAKWRLVG